MLNIFHDRSSRALLNINPLMRIVVVICIVFMCGSTVHAEIDIKVTVEGVEGDLKKNVLAYLGTERQKDHPDLNVSHLKKLHEEAPEEIRKSLQPFGYYNPLIRSELLMEGEAWRAAYTIDLGQPVLIESVDLAITGSGADDNRFKRLEKDFSVKNGNVLNHQIYEEAKRSFQDIAMQFGYLDGKAVKNKVQVHPDKNSATVVLHFNTGPQYCFGDVEFVQDAFDIGLLEGFVPFRRGDPYMVSRLLQLQNTLNDSDYFESVEVTPLTEEAEEREVPVQVKLVPRKRNKYTVGLGYGTDTGLRGSLGWEIRRVTRTGHRFKSELRLSEIRTGITGEYTVPLTNPRTDNLSITSGWFTEDTETSESEKLIAGIRYNHRRLDWKKSVYMNYEQETFEVGEDSGRSTLFIPGISWTRIRADNPVSVRHGSRLFFDIRGAHESLISDESFVQFRVQAKYISGVTPLSRLIIRAEGGSSLVDEFSELPPSVRFFSGGDNSVRGYAYNSLGAEDADGNVQGGRHLMEGSIEFEHQIIDKWSWAVFYDIGNAINDFSDSLKSGAGFGIRWKSPVGPVRVDLAFPLDESNQSWRVHFVIGPDL